MSDASRFSLDMASLRQKLGEATCARAREVYALQKVRDGFEVYQSGGQDWHFVGDVAGSHREIYQVEVEAEITPWGEISALTSQCSCPVASLCKHAGALMLKAAYRTGSVVDSASAARAASPPNPTQHHAAQTPTPAPTQKAEGDKPQNRQDRAVEQWLDLFGDSGAADAPIVPGHVLDDTAQRGGSGEDRLVFAIQKRAKEGETSLCIAVRHAREKVNGGWGKPHELKPWVTVADPAERELVQLVRALARASASGYYSSAYDKLDAAISGDSGMLALRLATQLGRLFLLNEDGKSLGTALHLGPQRPLQWQWHEVQFASRAEAAWQLRARVDGASIYPNQPLLYLDETLGQIGLVGHEGITAQRMAGLLKSPPIAQSAWQQHEQTMLRHLAGLPLPPFAKAPLDVKDLAPQPKLFVMQVDRAQQERFGPVMMVLHFAYGAVKFFSHRQGTPVLLEAKDHVDAGALPGVERMLLHRDVQAESMAISFLHQQGLAGNTGGQFFRQPAGFADTLCWLQWVEQKFESFVQAGFVVEMADDLHSWITHAESLQFGLHDDRQGQAPDGAGKKPRARPGAGAGAGAGSGAPAGEPQSSDGASAWFDLSLGIEVGGQRINILPVLPLLIEQVRMLRSQFTGEPADFALPESMYVPYEQAWLRLPTEPLKPWLAALLELVTPELSLKGESLRLSRFDALRLGAALGEGAVWEGAAGLRQLLAQLKAGAHALQTPLLPEGLRAELRPYQLQGLGWLQFLRQQSLAGVLADDMGLGKTLQTLAHILLEKENGRLTSPALIITPVSLLGNWQREAARFTPGLRTLVLHGSERHEAAQDMLGADLVLTPYSLLARDRERWQAVPWSLVVLDEAQNIKNATTDAAQAAFDLPARQRLCLSGTPIENHLGELWSLFHFLMPGFLGSQKRFKELYRTPIEKHGDSERLAELSRRVTPFMLRRTKKVVAKDLPDKIETLSSVTLQGKQADLYETIRLATEQSVRQALATRGLAKSQIQVLDALLKLRQVCCDPRLVPTAAAKKVKQSAKLEHLMDILPEMLAEGRRVLLFSQFTSMLELIEAALAERKLKWVKLTGQSTKRDAIIERFTSGQVPLFLISLKAGGVGLNLPQADTVIHYDPWWNPAVENQATDRAHRIGQTQQVFVYKLVASGTIEERMLALQERKAQLAAGMLGEASARKQALFTEDDISQLLKPLGA